MLKEILIEEIPLGSSRIKQFVDFAWYIHRKNPNFIPQLRGELLGSSIFNLVGLLTPAHPYHRQAEVTHFLAMRSGKPVGRISAAINHRFNEYHSLRIGFFGFFDVIEDYGVAEALLNKASEWVAERGMTILRGPGEYSNTIYERQGVLIEGHEYPPMLDITHNPPYYSEFLERYGFIKAKDFYAYMLDIQKPAPDRLKLLAERIRRQRQIETRPIILNNLESEAHIIAKIYNEAWAQNWGFLPITDEEALVIANSLRIIGEPDLVRFAFVKQEPVAVLGAFPDPNHVLRPHWRWYGDSDLVRLTRFFLGRRKLRNTRLMFFGVCPGFRRLGIDALLFYETKEYAMQRGYQQCELSLLLEDNELILRVSEFMGAHRYKTWRVYDLPLS